MGVELSKKAEKALLNWTADDLYVNIRPFTSTYVKPKKPHAIRWSVSVELRALPHQMWCDSGSDLSEIIEKLSKKISRRSELQPGYKCATDRGYKIPDVPTAPLGGSDAVERMKTKKGKKK